jgi:hypothetical protein
MQAKSIQRGSQDMVLERPTVRRVGRYVDKDGALFLLQALPVPGEQMGFAITGRCSDGQATDRISLTAIVNDSCDEVIYFPVEEIRVVNFTPGGIHDLAMKWLGAECP